MQHVQHSEPVDVDGKPTRSSGALLGKGAVIVGNDVAVEGRDQFYHWHDKEHIPERLTVPGFRRGRRYIKPTHSPDVPGWVVLVESSRPDAAQRTRELIEVSLQNIGVVVRSDAAVYSLEICRLGTAV